MKDDATFLETCINFGRPIPPGKYEITRPLIVKNNPRAMFLLEPGATIVIRTGGEDPVTWQSGNVEFSMNQVEETSIDAYRTYKNQAIDAYWTYKLAEAASPPPNFTNPVLCPETGTWMEAEKTWRGANVKGEVTWYGVIPVHTHGGLECPYSTHIRRVKDAEA